MIILLIKFIIYRCNSIFSNTWSSQNIAYQTIRSLQCSISINGMCTKYAYGISEILIGEQEHRVYGYIVMSPQT